MNPSALAGLTRYDSDDDNDADSRSFYIFRWRPEVRPAIRKLLYLYRMKYIIWSILQCTSGDDDDDAADSDGFPFFQWMPEARVELLACRGAFARARARGGVRGMAVPRHFVPFWRL